MKLPLRQSGFSMLEVLISVLVLSIGLLAAAGMQANSIAANREARLTSVGVVYAREIGELMRGNKIVATASGGANPYLIDATSSTTPPGDCYNSQCPDPTAMASWQVSEWLGRVMNDLPGAHVTICYDATPYSSNGIPQWACSGTGGVAVVKIGWSRRSTDTSASGAAAIDHATVPAIVLPVIAGSTL